VVVQIPAHAFLEQERDKQKQKYATDHERKHAHPVVEEPMKE
jgi:hypothetical protein